jgi:hypothetical protein
MFDLFQKNKDAKPDDVKTIRDAVLRFIKEQLQKAEGGEGSNIRALQLFVYPTAEEKHLYESALHVGEEERFRSEVQRIADDYAIDLPGDWQLQVEFVDAAPAETLPVPQLHASLFVQTRKRSLQKLLSASVKIISGEAEQPVYSIQSTDGRINIGRDKQVQTDNGFYRVNQIAFPSSSQNELNKFISRQHAHIEFDNETGSFLLFADEGGVPPRNKVKVLSTESDEPVKLYSTHIGYTLKQGDQIKLGDAAVLEFNYSF